MFVALRAALVKFLPRASRTRVWIRAAAEGDLGLAEALTGSDIDFKIALAFAVQFAPARLVRRLLTEARARGANPDLRVDGAPLLLVAHRSAVDPAEKRELLAQAGAKLDSRVGVRSWTLLGFAAFFGDAELARFLLSRGVVAGQTDKNGLTPIEMARIGGQKEIEALLLSYGAEDIQPRLTDIESLFIAENLLWAQVHESVKGGIRAGGAELDRLEIELEPSESVRARFRYFFKDHLVEVEFDPDGTIRAALLTDPGRRGVEDLLGGFSGKVSLRDLRARTQASVERARTGRRQDHAEQPRRPAESGLGFDAQACAVLGIQVNATAGEVLRAYRALAKRHHPDAAGPGGDPARMVEINLAYERLRKKIDGG